MRRVRVQSLLEAVLRKDFEEVIHAHVVAHRNWCSIIYGRVHFWTYCIVLFTRAASSRRGCPKMGLQNYTGFQKDQRVVFRAHWLNTHNMRDTRIQPLMNHYSTTTCCFDGFKWRVAIRIQKTDDRWKRRYRNDCAPHVAMTSGILPHP